MFNLRTLLFVLLSVSLLLVTCSEDKTQHDDRAANEKSQNNTDTITSQQVLSASLDGNIEVIEKALEQEVDVTEADQTGRTPLMLASFNGYTEIVQLLLEHGADPDNTDNQGQTALSFAASGAYPETVELLLNNGADPDQTDAKEGWTALMWAASEGNEQVVKVLLDHNANPDIRDKDDETARDFAENNGHNKVADILEQVENSE